MKLTRPRHNCTSLHCVSNGISGYWSSRLQFWLRAAPPVRRSNLYSVHMVGHPRCVFINYIWLNQLSNTTNLWWIDVYYLVINYMFRRLWPSSDWLIDKKHTKAVTFGMRLLYLRWGVGLLDGGTRSQVCWVWRGVYYANLSFVKFRTMMLGIHVYVYIGYMVTDTQWVILYSMW